MTFTYKTSVTYTASEILERNVAEKGPGLPEMFSTSVMRRGNLRRGIMKHEAEEYRIADKTVQKACENASQET